MADAPDFFVPTTHRVNLEELYARLRQYNTLKTGYKFTPRRIFSLTIAHNGTLKTEPISIQVGRPLGERGEVVIAIFEAKGWYAICTKNYGALVGSPIWVDAANVTQVLEFTNAHL